MNPPPKRRRFVESALLAGASLAMRGTRAWAASTRRPWILPTDTPDRHHLKVMAWNPIPAPDPGTWTLQIGGLAEQPMTLRAGDLDTLPRIEQSSRLKCVQCWSGRVRGEGFRAGELLTGVGAKT
jgi:DMSO/TMAO reductase YedYZ molybdopterin-dependent catalytic subunit